LTPESLAFKQQVLKEFQKLVAELTAQINREEQMLRP
jgi:hypothetical protein